MWVCQDMRSAQHMCVISHLFALIALCRNSFTPQSCENTHHLYGIFHLFMLSRWKTNSPEQNSSKCWLQLCRNCSLSSILSCSLVLRFGSWGILGRWPPPWLSVFLNYFMTNFNLLQNKYFIVRNVVTIRSQKLNTICQGKDYLFCSAVIEFSSL